MDACQSNTHKACNLCNKRNPHRYISAERVRDSRSNRDNYRTASINWVTVHFSRWDSVLDEPALMTRVAEYIRAGRGIISSYPKNVYLSWCYSVGVDRTPELTDHDVLDRAVALAEQYIQDARAGWRLIDVETVFIDGRGDYIFI